ncbi:hypothetical protein DFJ73DRAFT_842044 [Zopfochytrium polystomum]|nr:hypothetical protein DFJ73DRAFT_842044 [Zopfochytrium polystomum]
MGLLVSTQQQQQQQHLLSALALLRSAGGSNRCLSSAAVLGCASILRPSTSPQHSRPSLLDAADPCSVSACLRFRNACSPFLPFASGVSWSDEGSGSLLLSCASRTGGWLPKHGPPNALILEPRSPRPLLQDGSLGRVHRGRPSPAGTFKDVVAPSHDDLNLPAGASFGTAASDNPPSDAHTAVTATVVCPPPFESVANTTGITACFFNSCCLPCPNSFAIHPQGVMHRFWKILTAVTAVSAASAAAVVVSFAVLPGQRALAKRQGGAFAVSLNVGVLMECAAVLVSSPNPERGLCASHFVDATMQNSGQCLGQGLLFVAGLHGVVGSMALILLNLHLSAVWKVQLLERFYYLTLSIMWVGIAIVTAIPAFVGIIHSSPGFLCLPHFPDLLLYVVVPEFLLVFTSVVLQIATLVYTFRNLQKSIPTTDERRHILRREIRLQWRSVLLSILFQLSWWGLIIAYLVLRPAFLILSEPTGRGLDLYTNWVTCLYENSPDGQDACSGKLTSSIPHLSAMGVLISLHLLGGVFSLIVFVLTNGPVLREWQKVLLPWTVRNSVREVEVTPTEVNSSRPSGFYLRSFDTSSAVSLTPVGDSRTSSS